MSRLTRDGTAEPVSRDQIHRRKRRQGSTDFPCSADHEQDCQPYPVDPYSAMSDDHTYVMTTHTHKHLVDVNGALATQFQGHRGQVLGCRGQNDLPHVTASRVHDAVDPFLFCQEEEERKGTRN